MSFAKSAKNRPPYKQLIKLTEKLNCNNCLILELGGGMLVESLFLLEKGYEVHVVDKDPESEKIANKLNFDSLVFNLQAIEEFNFTKSKYDAVVSFLTLPFIEEINFMPTLSRVMESIKSGGYIMASFFGEDDSWNGVRKNMTFVTKNELINIFKDFEIIELLEEKKIAPMSNGVLKDWHIFKIFAKKRPK